MIPAGLAVTGFDHGRAENVLHLGGSLLKGRQSSLDKQLTGLESNLGSRARLQLCKLAEDRLEIFSYVANIGLVGAVDVHNGEDQVVLGANLGMRKYDLNLIT